ASEALNAAGKGRGPFLLDDVTAIADWVPAAIKAGKVSAVREAPRQRRVPALAAKENPAAPSHNDGVGPRGAAENQVEDGIFGRGTNTHRASGGRIWNMRHL